MSSSMAAVVQYGLTPGAVEVREMPIPEIGEDEVLLQVGGVSVCGSDVHQYHATQSWPVNTPVTNSAARSRRSASASKISKRATALCRKPPRTFVAHA